MKLFKLPTTTKTLTSLFILLGISLTSCRSEKFSAPMKLGGKWGGRRNGSWSGPGIELLEGHAVLLLAELFDLELGVLQPGLAGLEQLVALLKLGEELGQRSLTSFHRLDDLLELGQGVLEGQAAGFGFHF